MLQQLVQAHTLGLVDDIGLQRVVDSACNDLRWARARYASQTGIKWDRVIKQLNRDIIAANDFLPDDKQVSSGGVCVCGLHTCITLQGPPASSLHALMLQLAC